MIISQPLRLVFMPILEDVLNWRLPQIREFGVV